MEGSPSARATFRSQLALRRWVPRWSGFVIILCLVAVVMVFVSQQGTHNRFLEVTDGRGHGAVSIDNAAEELGLVIEKAAVRMYDNYRGRMARHLGPPNPLLQPFMPDNRLPARYSDALYQYPYTAPGKRANACILVLARNNDLNDLIDVLKSFEEKFNYQYNYPYLMFNDVEFTDEFKKGVKDVVSGPVTFALVPPELWAVPDHIDMDVARVNMEQMKKEGVLYGSSVPYRQMCRFFSGTVFKSKELLKYDYYWRLDSAYVRFHCSIDFDPFVFLEERNMVYGFTIALHEYSSTIPTLWETTMEYMKEQNLESSANWMNFFTDNGDSYNGHHFWSNFEIGSVRFFAGEKYQHFFDYLDHKGGFFYERWGDAPIHSLGLGLYARYSQVHWFNEIGYYHIPFSHCPVQLAMQERCNCQTSLIVSDVGFSALYSFLSHTPAAIQCNDRRATEAAYEAMEIINSTMPCGMSIMVQDSGQWVTCSTSPFENQCIVYSFTVKSASLNLAFETETLKKGCSVYFFSQWYSPDVLEEKVKLWDETDNVYGFHWYQITLSSVDADMERRHDSNNLMMTERRLSTLMWMLGHEEAVLDVVKFDVEGDEWAVLWDMLQSGVLRRVKHLMFEVHLKTEVLWKYTYMIPKVLQELQANNFQLVSSTKNPHSIRLNLGDLYVPCCYKLVYRNMLYALG